MLNPPRLTQGMARGFHIIAARSQGTLSRSFGMLPSERTSLSPLQVSHPPTTAFLPPSDIVPTGLVAFVFATTPPHTPLTHFVRPKSSSLAYRLAFVIYGLSPSDLFFLTSHSGVSAVPGASCGNTKAGAAGARTWACCVERTWLPVLGICRTQRSGAPLPCPFNLLGTAMVSFAACTLKHGQLVLSRASS